jgi:hypothetical protein
MQLGATNLALGTTNEKVSYTPRELYPIIYNTSDGIQSHIHSIKDIGLNQGDYVSFSADL